MRSEPEQASADFERIVPRRPAGRDASSPSAGTRVAADPKAAAQVSATAFWFGALLLGVVAVLAFWLLPRSFAPAPAPAPAPSVAKAAPVPPPAPAPSQTPVWDDPSALEARAAAQAARERFDQDIAQLRVRGVERWGAAALIAAEARAADGARAFGARDFAAARSAYQTAATAAATLLAEIPSRLGAALATGEQALDAADKAAAQAAFELAQALEPGNARAQRGLHRLANLDAVQAKLETARRLEQAGDLAAAHAAFEAALQLDPDTQPAREALARLDADAREAAFRRALGAALEALDAGRHDEAEQALARARALRPGDAAVQQAGARLAEARRVRQIGALQREAAAHVAAEEWDTAVARYRAAQQLDPNLVSVREGIARAEPRAALARRLQDAIDRPQRLSSPAVMAEAQRTLAEARAIADAGPRLRAQIAALENALSAAATPVAVQLRSDGLTEVTVHRVGPLGRFQSHALELKPGRYVAVGSRAGYRDVRAEFEVRAGGALDVDVRCTETL